MKRTAWLQERRMEKFEDVLGRFETKRLSAMDAAELLGMSERSFRRYRQRYEEEGLEGLFDRRLGKASARRVPVDRVMWMLEEYRTRHTGWTVKHFHDHLRDRHGFTLMDQDHPAAGGPGRQGAQTRGASPEAAAQALRRHDAAPGRLASRMAGQMPLDLIVTLDDATSEIYSAFLVEEEGTASTFRALKEVFAARGLPGTLYTDRGSHYFHTPAAGGKVDKERRTQVGRALHQLGIEHIAAYSPEARRRSERAFGTLQDRLVKELALAGITTIEAANRFIEDIYLPDHNRRFAMPPELEDPAFVPLLRPQQIDDILCLHAQRIVGRDNTVRYGKRILQRPAGPDRPHYVKAHVRIHEYPDGTLAVFHGPRYLARYRSNGEPIDTHTRKAA